MAVNKLVYYLLFKVIGKIKNIIRNSQLVCYPFGIQDIFKRAAGMRAGDSGIFVMIQFHSAAYAVKSPVLYKLSGDAGINAAAHCNQCFHFTLFSLNWF